MSTKCTCYKCFDKDCSYIIDIPEWEKSWVDKANGEISITKDKDSYH